MGRKRRSNLPGCVFHLTARIHGGERLLLGLESTVAELLHHGTRHSDTALLAYAIMPNHLHAVVQQGTRPLAAYMQPLLCRTALLLQRRHRREGHIFERRYFDVACTDADYFRNIIAYVHLNPVRAGLCASPDEYAWTSHAAYSTLCREPATEIPGMSLRFRENVLHALRIYDAEGDIPSASYGAFIRWRADMDAFIAAGGDPREGGGPPRPACMAGDMNWRYALGSHSVRGPDGAAPTIRKDISTIARNTLAELAPDASLEWLRSGERLRSLVAVRRLVIGRALDAGHSRPRIARYLNVSLATISAAALALRGPRHP